MSEAEQLKTLTAAQKKYRGQESDTTHTETTT